VTLALALDLPPGSALALFAIGRTAGWIGHIEVITSAADPEADVLTFSYVVSGGRIVGAGAKVLWDLTGIAPGRYTITVGVDDGAGIVGERKTRTVTVD
jgi:hypothetical protein